MYPTLLTVPPELRTRILETLFYGAELSTLCKRHRPNPFQRPNYAILTANKQVHREASTILFHGAVLRLDIPETDDHLPHLTTKTVIPVWSWYVRDRYRDNGTDLEFLQRWYGLGMVKDVEMRLSFKNKNGIDWHESDLDFMRYVEGCKMAVDFLNGLPGVESLTIYTDAEGDVWIEKCKEVFRELKFAKLRILARNDGCGHQSALSACCGAQ